MMVKWGAKKLVQSLAWPLAKPQAAVCQPQGCQRVAMLDNMPRMHVKTECGLLNYPLRPYLQFKGYKQTEKEKKIKKNHLLETNITLKCTQKPAPSLRCMWCERQLFEYNQLSAVMQVPKGQIEASNDKMTDGCSF